MKSKHAEYLTVLDLPSIAGILKAAAFFEIADVLLSVLCMPQKPIRRDLSD